MTWIMTDESLPLESQTTITLIRHAQAGNRRALEIVAARLLPRLRRWAAGRLPAWARDLADTQDLVQETVTNVLTTIDQFEPRHEAAFTVYVRAALANRLKNEMRRAVRHPAAHGMEAAADHVSPRPSPLEEAITHQALDRYEAALALLDDEDREAIVGRVELHYSYQELADAWGKPSAEAARKAVERAVRRLAEAMNVAK
jgi:RNA polymerase sigma-70 factor, ECF subfamily